MKTVSKMWGRTSLLFLVPLLLAFSAWAQESKPFKAEELDQCSPRSRSTPMPCRLRC